MAEPLVLRIDVDDKGIPKIKALHGELDKLDRGIKDSGREMGRWEKSLNKVKDTLFSMRTALAAVGGAYAAMKLARIAKGWMDLAGAQEAAEASMRQVMVSMGRYSKEFYASTLAQASALQKLTGMGDEAIIQGQKFLLTFKQISDEAMPKTTKAMLDLAALMGGDVQRAALTLGKASMGLTGELRRVGITVDETTFKQKGFLGVLEEIETQVKGQAVTFRQVWLGILMALRSEWGDLREVIGGWMRDIARPWGEKFVSGIRTVTDWLKRMKEEGRLDEWSDKISLSVTKLFNAMKQFFITVKDHLDDLSFAFGILLKAIKAVMAYQIASFFFRIGDAAISAAANIDKLAAALAALKLKVMGLGISAKGGLIGLALYGGWELGKFLERFSVIRDAATWMAMQLEYSFKYVKREILVSWEIIGRDINKITVNIMKGVNFMLSGFADWVNDLIETANKLSMINIEFRMPELKIDYSSALARQERAMLRISEINTEFNEDIVNTEKAYLSMFSTAYEGFNAYIIKGTAGASRKTKDLAADIDTVGDALDRTGKKTEQWRNEISRSVVEMSDMIENELEPDVMSVRDALREIGEAIDPITDSIKEMSDMIENEFEPDVISVREHMQEMAEVMDPTMKEMRRLWEEGWSDMEDHFVYGFAAMLRSGIDDFKDFARAIYDIFRNMLTRIAAEKFMRPVAEQLVKSLSGSIGALVGSMGFAGLGATTGLTGMQLATYGGGTIGALRYQQPFDYMPYLGYGLIGAGIGYAQGGTGGGFLGGLGGIGGYALGGPIGGLIGGIVGGLIGDMFESAEKPKIPEISLVYDIVENDIKRIEENWKYADRSQPLIDSIEGILNQQIEFYERIRIFTGEKLTDLSLTLKGVGADIGMQLETLAGLAGLGRGLSIAEQLAKSFAYNMDELVGLINYELIIKPIQSWSQEWQWQIAQALEPFRLRILNILGLPPEMRPQELLNIITEIRNLFNTWWPGGQNPTEALFESSVQAIVNYWEKSVIGISSKMAGFESMIAESLAAGFEQSIMTREFDDFMNAVGTGFYTNIRKAILQAFAVEIYQKAITALWQSIPIFANFDQIISDYVGALTGEVTGQTAQQYMASYQDLMSQIVTKVPQALEALEPLWKTLTDRINDLTEQLGLNTGTIEDNTGAIIDNTSILDRQRRIEDFLMSLTTGQQAPVQSLEAIENVYKQLLRTDEDLTQLFSYITGTYLPFMQAYGGDYQAAFQKIVSDLMSLAGYSQYESPTGNFGVPPAMTYESPTGSLGTPPATTYESLTGSLGTPLIVASQTDLRKVVSDVRLRNGDMTGQYQANYSQYESQAENLGIPQAAITSPTVIQSDYVSQTAQAELQKFHERVGRKFEEVIQSLDMINNTARHYGEKERELFSQEMTEMRNIGYLIMNAINSMPRMDGALAISARLESIESTMKYYGDKGCDFFNYGIEEIRKAGNQVVDAINLMINRTPFHSIMGGFLDYMNNYNTAVHETMRTARECAMMIRESAELLSGLPWGGMHVHLNLDGRQIAEIVAMEIEAGNNRLVNAVRQVM